jgi:transcriptional regulator GlxA family with amidase domain
MIEKKIGAALALTIGAQSVTALLWAGAAAERIDVLERQVERAEPIAERLARMEAQLELTREQLDRIEAKVERS